MTSLRTLRPVLLSLIAAVALALPAAALAAGFTAHLYIGTHTPRVGRQRITVTATRGRQKLSGRVSYQFTYNGAVVGRAPRGLVQPRRLPRHAQVAGQGRRAHHPSGGGREHTVRDRVPPLVDQGLPVAR